MSSHEEDIKDLTVNVARLCTLVEEHIKRFDRHADFNHDRFLRIEHATFGVGQQPGLVGAVSSLQKTEESRKWAFRTAVGGLLASAGAWVWSALKIKTGG